MSKPALYYTLKRDWYAGGFRIMAVTSEKGRSWPSHLYGRFHDTEMATHCAAKETVGKYETAEAAEAVIHKVATTRKAFHELVEITGAMRALAERAERDAIEDVANGRECAPPPALESLMKYAAKASPSQRKMAGVFGAS